MNQTKSETFLTVAIGIALLAMATGVLSIAAWAILRTDEKITAAPVHFTSLNSPSNEQEPSVSLEKEELSPAEEDLHHDALRSGTESSGDSRKNDLQEQPLFRNPIIAEWIHLHPNGPHKLIPKDARPDELEAYETEAAAILDYHQRIRDALLKRHDGNLIAFTEDPDVLQNDRDRQMKLMNLVRSIWPKARTP